MACSNSLKRRLLLSIIRAPTWTRQIIPIPSTKTRSFHATRWSQNEGFSVSFGPEIDGLLYPAKKASSSTALGKVRSRKTDSKTSSSGTSTLKPNKRSKRDDVATTNLDSKEHRSSTDATKGRQFQAEPTFHSYEYSDKPKSNSDQTTIELSEDAYVAISKPEVSHLHSPKPLSQHLGPVVEGIWRKEEDREASKQQSRVTLSTPQPRKRSEQWQTQKDALQKKFGEDGWNPRKKLSPDAMEGIRTLHEQDPERYSTPMLAQQFKMSPEAIRRILKSKWRPSTEDMEKRRERWARRHDRIWDQKAALGLRPARRIIREVEGPEAFEEEMKAKQALGQI